MYLRNDSNSKRAWLRRSIAAVELACVAPVLATILVGILELGRGVMVKETLNNAARKACRTGIQRDKSSTDIYNDAVNIMTDNGFDNTKFNPVAPGGTSGSDNIGYVTITVTDPDGNTLSDALNAPEGSVVTVQVGIPASSVYWVTQFFLQGSMVESENMVMMKQ